MFQRANYIYIYLFIEDLSRSPIKSIGGKEKKTTTTMTTQEK